MNNTASTLSNEITVFRRFNRMYTRFIGTLNEGLLNSPFSLAEARVLYELATRNSPKAREIAEELGLDAGYLSRLLGKFERDGLLKRKQSGEDGRYADLSLTPRGRAAFKKLNALSEEQAQTVLGRMPPSARIQLIDCMRVMEGILSATERSGLPYILRPHRIGDMGWVVYREGVCYAEEFGWDETFEALVAHIVEQFVTNYDPGRDRCWIAEIDGESVGHIFLVKHPDEPHTAKLRLLFVEPGARGKGLGDALVKECVRFARMAGYKKVVLWTHSVNVGAHHIYERAGFCLVKEEPRRNFGKDLLAQTWELNLK